MSWKISSVHSPTIKGDSFWKWIAWSHRKYRKNLYLLCFSLWRNNHICRFKKKTIKKNWDQEKTNQIYLRVDPFRCMEEGKDVSKNRPVEESLASQAEIRTWQKSHVFTAMKLDHRSVLVNIRDFFFPVGIFLGKRISF